MLGPALKQLFFDLHHRPDPPLSKFEQLIHRELLGILLTEQFERSVLGDRVGALARARTESMPNVEVPKDSLESLGIAGGIGEIFGSGPNLNLQIDLSGSDRRGSPGMQLGCGETNCRYKEL